MIRSFIVSADPMTVRRVAADLTKQDVRACVVRAVRHGDHELATLDVSDGVDTHPTTFGLTPLRIAHLNLLAEGLSYREIADRHGVGIATTKRTIQLIYRRLGAKDRAHAVLIACRAGLIREGAA
ncbi:response regulator transcription factor [Amycolatopsis sp. CFH S0078]|uniref:response regulator transcription factor n=1 Tax=Amycolatopsis sp. CFH S0078 TaxID=1644108 RepID=UPI00106E6B41|nr:helix-turn-helix transcriptional regulator [Amycolatopsis sp. CFH S0078]